MSSAHPLKPHTPLKPGKTSAASINKELAKQAAAVAPATPATFGTVKQGAIVANAMGAAPTAAEYLALLTSLRAAGIIASA